MIDFLSQYKRTIDQTLHNFLQKKKQELSRVNPWGSDAITRLSDFVVRGKTIRGSLTIFSYRMFRNDLPDELIETAAALELFHSGFLIHDDIADRDKKRRGIDSAYYSYQKMTKNNHTGISLAIQVGDLAFFLGFELTSTKIYLLIAQELAKVCAAQMQDIAKTASGQKDILALYRYKTARYTFSLPLVVGATLAQVDPSTIKKLELIGEQLGLLYQMRDDELDNEPKRLTLSAKKLSDQVQKQIASLPVRGNHKQSLLELVRFCMVRKK